jgi:hypothetical protein
MSDIAYALLMICCADGHTLIFCVAELEQYNNGHDLEKSWACIGVMSKRNEGSKDSPELWMRSW